MNPAALTPVFLASLIATVVLAILGFRNAFGRGGRDGTALIVAIALLGVQTALYAGFTVDDSFIAFRFARNWAEGLGPVYQAGDRVEGHTCLLWVAMLALAGRLGLDIELAAKVLGIVSSTFALVGTHRLVLQLRGSGPAARLAPLLLALSPLFVAWTFAGMDAPLFAALLVWAAHRLAAESRRPGGFPVSALLFALLVLARPEGALFAATAWASRVMATPRRWRDAMIWALVCAAIVAPYWAWRWSYYGDFLPNTFYAKAGLGLGRLVSGVASLGDFAADSGALPILLALIGAIGTTWRDVSHRFVCISLLAFLTYVVAVGGDVLHLRFYVHVLPLWTVCVALGLEQVEDRLRGGATVRARETWASALALGIVWAGLTYREHSRALVPANQFGAAYVVDNSNNIHRSHMPLGDWLRTHAPPGSRLAATDIGGLGYRSRLPIIDLYGLTDRAIAHLFHRGAGAAELAAHVRRENPAFFVLYGSSKGAGLGWLEREVDWIRQEFHEHSFWPDSPLDKGMVLLVRKDVRVPPPSPPGRELGPRRP